MSEQTQALPFIDGLYAKLVEGGVRYFFPPRNSTFMRSRQRRMGRALCGPQEILIVVNWLVSRYSLTPAEAFSGSGVKSL